jgi:hypothetical protein
MWSVTGASPRRALAFAQEGTLPARAWRPFPADDGDAEADAANPVAATRLTDAMQANTIVRFRMTSPIW